ncbi:hypothetical protein ACGFIE_32265 [Micromonospora sp. NPDC049275]|uniref:hypothetical protein n=1 Tax=Micromonospora sp. NPDC049275 TaxID=3364268 RepID=UPI00371F4C61
MTFEDELRTELRHAPMPTELAPPIGLADTVLRGARRRKRRTAGLLAGVVALVALVLVTPAVLPPDAGPDTPALQVAAGAFPQPGGGPLAVHAYVTSDLNRATFTTLLLDPTNGEYREVPYRALLAPDRSRVAVDDNGRTGLVDRAALLRDGTSAIQWLDLPVGNGLAWSPDGAALLVTSIEKGDATVSFTAHRYDVRSGKVTATPVPVDLLGSAVGWAPDSVGYLALLRGSETGDTVRPGALQEIRPDGALGRRLAADGGGWVGGAESYSPSRRYLLADVSELQSDRPLPSRVVDVVSGRVVRLLPVGAKPLGWYDDRTVALLVDPPGGRPVLRLTDVASGATRREVPLAGVPGLIGVCIASSSGLPEDAVALGF